MKKFQILCSGENKKNIISLLSSEYANRVVKVKVCGHVICPFSAPGKYQNQPTYTISIHPPPVHKRPKSSETVQIPILKPYIFLFIMIRNIQ